LGLQSASPCVNRLPYNAGWWSRLCRVFMCFEKVCVAILIHIWRALACFSASRDNALCCQRHQGPLAWLCPVCTRLPRPRVLQSPDKSGVFSVFSVFSGQLLFSGDVAYKCELHVVESYAENTECNGCGTGYNVSEICLGSQA
jgi:hypothetical protein